MSYETLRSYIPTLGPSREVVFECRRCGATHETDATSCRNCDTDSIARYVIE